MATNFSYPATHKNPGQIWANLSIPAGGARLTLDANGEPDATENPNALHLGLTEAGATVKLNGEYEDEFFDEFREALDTTHTQTAMMLNADLSQVYDFDVLELCTKGIGTRDTGAGYDEISIGRSPLGFTSIAVITPRRDDPTKFAVTHIYSALNKSNIELATSRQTRSKIPVEFVGYGIPGRADSDTLGKIWTQV